MSEPNISVSMSTNVFFKGDCLNLHNSPNICQRKLTLKEKAKDLVLK